MTTLQKEKLSLDDAIKKSFKIGARASFERDQKMKQNTRKRKETGLKNNTKLDSDRSPEKNQAKKKKKRKESLWKRKKT